MANPNSRATKRTLAAAAPSIAVDGTFTTTYTAQLLNDDGSYTPQATIINFRFLPDGTHHGTVHRNLAGNAPGELVFKGSYRLDYNSDLALYEGELRLTLSKNGKPTLLVERDNTLMKHLSHFINFTPSVYANEKAIGLLKSRGLIEK